MPDYLLSGYRALDLTDEKGFLCGKILASLGVDVIKIEKPGGDPSRNIPPYYHNSSDPEESLYWFSYNSNKRGITLDLETGQGQDLFKRLLKTSHFVIESFSPGYLNSLGLGYEALSKLNPEIILTSITPFGQNGPYSKFKASDLVVGALSVMISYYGDPDRSPVPISIPQTYMHAGANAAEGTMMAHYYRSHSGEGQHVDVSAMESAMMTATIGPLTQWLGAKKVVERAGSNYVFSGLYTPNVWECKDGYVTFQFLGGKIGARTNKALTEWMDSEGQAPDLMKERDWENWDLLKTSQSELDELADALRPFFKNHTKKELQAGATKRRVMLYMAANTDDTFENEQLQARDFWENVEHEKLNDTITYPGPFAKIFPTAIEGVRPAPSIGEHNEDVYVKELGMATEEFTRLKEEGII